MPNEKVLMRWIFEEYLVNTLGLEASGNFCEVFFNNAPWDLHNFWVDAITVSFSFQITLQQYGGGLQTSVTENILHLHHSAIHHADPSAKNHKML